VTDSAATPEAPLPVLPALGRAELHQILIEWNDTAVPLVAGTLHELVAAQAARTPAAVALVSSRGETWSYGELERSSNRLARHLRRLGVGPETRVGVCLERSPEMVMVLLAVLKAGGAYVPLDLDYPAERLRFILADSAAGVVVTRRAARARAGLDHAMAAAADGGLCWVDLEAAAPAIGSESPAAPADSSGAGNLAYLIYTSGSTGYPKGVAIEHRNAVQLLAWAREVFAAPDLACVLAATSICFDLSVFELFLPLCAGGRVVVAANALALEGLPPAVRESITLVNTVPSVMAQLIRAGALPSTLRVVCLAGEPLKRTVADAVHGAAAGARVLNLYGPSEDTTYSTWSPVPRGGQSEPEIGRPITGTRAYVLDADLIPVPPGEPGELALAGAGLARGYLGRPELTAERFVPDPFGSFGGRLYRTGDRARHLAAGQLEFLGRADDQVKVRGFRIELGEVEAVLARHPGVREAAVVVVPDTAGERQLVAYAEAAPGLAAEELRAWLAQRLPAYMVPTLFQVMAALPRTPNLKIDRRALSSLDRQVTAAGRAPSTPFEISLAQLAGDLLGLSEVAADADLLGLGAHSLLVAQMVTRVRQDLGLELTLAEVFEARTVAALADLLEARRRRGERPAVPPLGPVPRTGDLPLSFAQERIWFLEQLAPGNLAYSFQFSLRFRGVFSPPALEAACTEVIRRHEIFRTTFPASGGRPVQVIHPPFAVSIPLVDLAALAGPGRREDEMERQIALSLAMPFVITRLPLIRWTLFRVAETDHVLLHVEHHFVHDGWSIGLVQNEIRALYRERVDGVPADLPAPGAQYIEYVVWQREWLQGKVLERQLAYWTERLAGSPPVLRLPADRPRPPAHSFRGDAFFFLLPGDLYRTVRQFGRGEGGSLFITMLAAFDVLLHRLSGQDDLVLATGIANRRLRELETMIGMVVNTVIFRNDLGGRPTFRELVARTRTAVLELHEYQDTPFEKLVAQLRPERHQEEAPLYQVAFAFHDAPMPELRFGDGLATELRYRHNRSAKADLNVIGIPHAEQRRGLPAGAAEAEMMLIWEYSTDLFDRTTAQRMWEHYLELLAGAVRDPGRRLDELPLLAAAQRHQLITEWNDTAPAAAGPAESAGLHGLVEGQAARRPGQTALVFGDRRVSYGELDRRASRLAAALAALGVGPEVRVGLLMERSVGMVVALLGILKAGGAYVPLDPMYPAERLGFVSADARLGALVADEALAAAFAGSGLPLLIVDDEGEAREAAGAPATAPALPPPGGRLAYVIYTSGSTGRPKGVEVEHRSAVNVIRAAIRDFGLGEGSRVVQLTSISFDVSVLEIFMTLGSGGTLSLVDRETRLSSGRLEELIRAQEIALLVLPPSLLETLDADALPSVATVILGGEATSAETLRRWAPGRRVFNCYGPTEASINSTVARCAVEDRRPPAIGRPIEGTRVHLLDRSLHPLALGATGELYVGGAAVARGYLGRPELSAERFLPDPFAAGPGERLYRTGDLARHLVDGRLEFVGRFDQQIKIRGLRIELGEIEAAAGQHPAVREVVVTVDRRTPSDPRLVAYVVPHAGIAGSPGLAAELRERLAARLPGYMVPAHVVLLDALPIHVHGKVDYKALPAPAEAAPATAFAPIAGSVEEALAEIWSDVLGTERVGAEDNFFELGGHSLLATQVLARVEEALAVRLPVRLLFENPTVRRLAAAIERQRGLAAPPPPPLARVPREGALPLSFAQQRMWFLDQLEPGNAAYNVSLAYRLAGALSLPALAGALVALAVRHEVLRTTYPSAGGRPEQCVAGQPRVPLALVDLSGLPAGQAESEAGRRAAEEAGRPCDLAAGPPLRTVVFRLAADDHLALFLTHHIVLDGSTQLFLRDLAALYEAATRGTASPLPALRFQYVDFAHWQRRWLGGGVLEGQLAYWLRQLGGELPQLQLPTDRPRRAVRSTRGAQSSFTLRGGLGEGMRTLARQHGATLFMTCLAALEVLLYRLTGQRDLCIGFPIADRPHPDLEGLIGCFVNTLVLRADLTGEPRFAGLLARVRETTLDAYAHKDLPFETLVEALDLPRDLSRTPLFQVLFVANTTPPPKLALPGCDAAVVPLASASARFDWLLVLRPEGRELGCHIEYSRELFDRSTIARVAGHLERLLAGLVADPGARIGELPLLAPAERHQLLAEWNDTGRAYDTAGTVHGLIEEQAARTPEAVAVIDDAGLWSYRDLDRHANRIAHQLRELGLQPGDAVGVHLERSAEMVAALLGVLKAGGTYVPLDAALPAERLRRLLARLAARHLLTSQALRERLGELPGLDGVVVLDGQTGAALPGGGRAAGRRELAAQPGESPRVAVPADALAYVIFTSGSTGVPKGVAVRHRAVRNLIAWINRDFGVGPGDRVLFLTAAGFDLSVYDMFGLLAAGGSVRVVSRDDARDPERLLALLLTEPITFWDSAPAALQQLVPLLPAVTTAGSGRTAALRRVFLSGDWIPTALPDRLRSAFPAARVVSLGGATEATVWSNVFPVEAVDPQWPSIPYGRPMPNARYHVLDPRLAPCPAGVEGDLYIAGDCLALGYAREPGLTAERFLPDPFDTGGRIYWTGDRARYFADGVIEFLGRRDQQVKIRGFRVELGEIETVLAQHPAVREAVVVAEGQGTDRHLIAYVVPGAGAVPLAALREHAAAHLPEYMVPAALVPLAALPLTAHGKLDRKALPRPDRSGLQAGQAGREVVAPRTPAEAVLARMWSEILGISPIGVHDDFFDLGGHSLLATQLAARVRDALRTDLPLRAFFESPTIAGLAQRLDAASVDLPALPPLVPRPHPAEPPPLSFAQQRLWFIDQLEPGSAVYNVPFGLRFCGRLDTAALVRGLAEIVRRHDTLRTVFRGEGGRPRQLIREDAATPLPSIDLQALPLRLRDAALDGLGRRWAARPFDLAAGPLVRFGLVELDAHDRVLLVSFHHIAADGWSVGVFLAELGALYAMFAAGGPPLPELAVRYGDFAAWQRSWLQGAVLEEQLGYWRTRLAGAPPVLDLPLDRPRPAAPSYRGGRRQLDLPPHLAEELLRLGRRSGATLFMTLLAAFQALIADATGETDVPVGAPIANRRLAGVEGLIGFFVNTLVLRGDLAGDPGFAALLAATREAALAAYAHQDVPFEQLVEELQPERDLGHAPLFQVLFALQNAPLPPLRLPGLEIALEPVESGISKYDLSLVMTETAAGITGGLTYASDLFHATTVERLARRFVVFLEEVAADPGRPLSSLSPLGPAERWQVIGEWNDRRSGYRREQTIAELFAGQAARAPDRVAVVEGESVLSYGELARRARLLAGELAARGVAAEVPVALLLERSIEMVVALLGILEAGGCYLPLDPQAPRERLLYMLEDAGAQLVLTHGEPDPRLLGAPVQQLALSAAGEAGAASAEIAPVDPENLAYVLYTSGSTGQPKGVRVPHRAVVRLVCGNDFAEMGPEQVFLQAAPLAFDASTLEVWGALLHGGRLVLMPPGTPALEELGETLVRHGITTLWLTAGLFHAMVDHRLADLAGLRQLLAGGDVLSPAHVRRVRAELPAVRLINGYGPTENTTFTVCHTVEPADRLGAGPIALGRPIRNGRVFVLDPHLRLRGAGLAGELYAAGDGLARDYLGRPALTAERFVPDPFAAEPGARLYRTGDRVRYLPDGRIEFLGRLDHQIKLRGFRIELGEIEAALAGHSEVAAAAVAVHEEAGDRRLSAYFVPATGAGTSAPGERRGRLREHLRERLPEYMIPAALVEVEALPLTAAGKVDRRALAALPLPADPSEVASWEEDRSSPYEELVAAIFADVLGRERIGGEDDFFALGGHSLLALQALSRLRAALGVDLALREVFERSTVVALAARLAELQSGAAPALPLVAAESEEERRRAPLSFSQERLWLVDRLEPGNPAYNVPAALRLRGRLAVAAFRQALTGLVERQAALRTRFELAGGEPVQVVEPAGPWPLPVTDLSGLGAIRREDEARRLAEAAARRRFDLTRGPLLRTLLLRLGAEEHLLLINLHHIVSDGWSVNVFYRELAALYEAALLGTPAALPELPVQYVDFARWQRRWAVTGGAESQLAYWCGQLAGASPLLELPLDHPRPPVQTHRGGQVMNILPVALCAGLRDLARQTDATVFMTLLAGFEATLLRWTGQEDLVVGTTVANRNRTEIEGLVGFFVNTLVLRIELAEDLSFAELLARVRRVTLEAYGHQDLPFEHLVERLKPQRDLRYSPLFQVMFSYQQSAVASRQLRSLTLSSMAVDTQTAKFDLSLLLHQGERGLRAVFEYNADLFDRTTVARLARQVENLWEGAVAAPAERLRDLPLLAPEERAQLLWEWNDTAAGPARLAPELIAAHAAATPEAVAVHFAGGQLTFAELERRAHRLAHHLRAQGVGAESRVGLHLDRGMDLLPAILGIWKAGGAFVPLPPGDPPQRLSYLMADARIGVVVTRTDLAPSLPQQEAVLVCLDADAAAIASRPATAPPACWNEAGLAYVLYTSGSTGRPKGTLISHGGLAHYLRHCLAAYPLDGGAPVYTSLGFDLTLTSLLAPLAAGRPVALLPEEHALENLAAALRPPRGGGPAEPGPWGFVKLTPAHLELLSRALPPADLGGRCRALIVGGEALRLESLADWREHAPETRLINEYGPTEAVVGCSLYEVTEEDAEEGPVPIGRPVTGARLYVLGSALQLLPPGTPGELCVAGAGLARGYLGRPDLTAERFVPDPFAALAGGRLYRTGDRACQRADGVLEFLGRLDRQVKLHGHRIEPAEVEAALCRHPGVRAAAVTVRDDLPGGRGLAAYWVAEGEPPPAEELRSFLAAELPGSMVPAAFTWLPALPLNRHGKVDPRALPMPEGLVRAQPWAAPESESEATLAGVVGEVLRLPRVGRDDNFFDLGAHSLTLVRVHERLLGLGLSGLTVLDLFRHPTVRGLAAHLGRPAEASSAAESAGRAEARFAARDLRQERRARRQGLRKP
jgi:amino acid adenylation domain-containing protein